MTIPKVRDDLALMDGYHSKQVDVAVRLNTNEAPLPPPPAFLDALQHELRAIPFHRYPDRSARALRSAIGALHGVGPEQVFAANGSNEVLQSLCLAYGGPGRAVAVFEPTYMLHTHIARVTGTAVASGARRDDFTIDMDEVERVLADARPVITFLCSPNNPTGRVEPRDVVEAIVARAPGLVVVDEAYGQFAAWSAMSLVAPDGPLVVTRTFSKTWSLAAARLGYLVGPPEVVSACEAVVLPYHLDAMKQVAGRLAVRFTAEMEARVSMLVEERGRVASALADLPVESWPSGANFILFRPQTRDGAAVHDALLRDSVLVRDCTTWPGLDGCLRVTIGTASENDAFLASLRKALA